MPQKIIYFVSIFLLFVLPGLVFAEETGETNKEFLQEYQLSVTGLDCKSCIPDVRKALKNLSGVKYVKITNFDKRGSATSVEVTPGAVSEENLMSALNADGFKAEVVSVGELREVVLEEESGFSLFDLLN